MNNKQEVLDNYEKWYLNFDYEKQKEKLIKDYYENPVCEFVQIHVTRKCNFRCMSCTREELYGNSKEAPNMDFGLFKEIIDKLPKTVKNVDMTSFGESMMHPNYEDMLKYIKESGRSISTFCNGSMFKLRYLQYFDTLIFSLDSADKEVLEKVRKGVNQENFLQKIIDTVKLRNEKKYKTNIQINFVMSSETEKSIDNVFEFCHEAGIDDLRITPYLNLYSPVDNGWFIMNKQLVKNNQVVDWQRPALVYSKHDYDFKLTVWYPRDNFKGICLYGAWRLIIDVDGSMRDCCFYYNNNPRVFGNLQKESFLDVYNGEKMTKFREAHIKDLPLKNCDGCSFGIGVPENV